MKCSRQLPVVPCMASTVAVAIAVAATPAVAQAQSSVSAEPTSDQAEALNSGIADIVVTAQRRESRIQETPIAVTAFDASSLTERGIRNVFDLQSATPNLSIVQSSSFGGSSTLQAYIRGVGASDYLFPNDPGVGYYIDGVYVARTLGGLQAITDVERVEVLKGPQGTLFGRNTIGGAISITTKQPIVSGGPTGSIEVRGGSYNRADGLAYVNAPLIDGILGAKLSVSRVSADGFGEQLTTRLKLGNEDKWIFRGALRLVPTADFDVTLTGDYSRARENGPAGTILRTFPSTLGLIEGLYNPVFAPALNPGLGLAPGTAFDSRWVTGNLYTNYGTAPSYDRYDVGGASLNAAWTAADWLTVRSITAYRALHAEVGVDLDGSPYPIFGQRIDQHSNQFSQELQLAGKLFDNRVDFLVGGYYFHEKARDETFVDIYSGAASIGIPLLSLSQRARTGIKVDSFAIFTEERIGVTDSINLVLGGRYTSDKKVYNKNLFLTELGTDLIPFTVLRDTFDAFTPKVGLNWKPTRAIMVYATWSKGFKSGGWNSRDNNTNSSVGNAPFNPEHVTTWEAGIKADWFERRLRTNIAVFTSSYRDIQLTTLFTDPATGSPTGSIENAGRARISGFEAEVTAMPVENLTLTGSAGYLHDKYDELSSDAIRTGITLGDRLANIPRWTASAGATWETDLGAAGRLSLHGDLSYKSKVYFDNLNTEAIAQSGYTLYAARIAFRPAAIKGLELSVSGTNVSNERYRVTGYFADISGYDYGFAGRPREIIGSIKYNF